MTALASEIRSDVLRQLVAHWQQIRGNRRMPARADFDPLEVRFALGYISLIEVHRDPLRFYFRLDGTKQVDLFGIDCTRHYLDEMMPADLLKWPRRPIAKSRSAASRAIIGGRSPSTNG